MENSELFINMNEFDSISDKAGFVYCINCCENSLKESNVKLTSPNNKKSATFYKSKDKTITLLAIENIIQQKDCTRLNKKNHNFQSCDFGENITTKGIDLSKLKVGDFVKVGNQLTLEIIKLGKNCYKYCSLYKESLGCVISKEFIFCKVSNEGIVNVGDEIYVL